MKLKIGVMFGGKSVEHEVSVISAIQAINALDKDKYEVVPVYISRDGRFFTGRDIGRIEAYRDIPALLSRSREVLVSGADDRLRLLELRTLGKPKETLLDVVLPVVHGTNVEDGALQGFLRTLGVPFAGCDVFASAVGMDKYAMKELFRARGLPVLDCVRLSMREFFDDPDAAAERVIRAATLPAVVKPVNLGSSVGIKVAHTKEELLDALRYAFQFAPACVAEKAVQNLREINCAVLGDADGVRASECEEPVAADEILSYEDKYVNGGKDGAKGGMQSLKRKLPAPISAELREKIRKMAEEAFLALDCAGVARIDFLMDGATEEVWVNEINTIPGSLSFYLWEPLGLKYPELLDELVSLAFKRARRAGEVNYSVETGILKNFAGGGAKGAKGAKL
jgi:D-alanine-D-alanine ligase